MPDVDSTRREPVFTPLPTGSRTSNVAAALRGAILSGDLPPGSPLPEVLIASSLGVSRAPVREALRMLQEEGLISKESYRGAFVSPIRPELVEEIRAVRMRIEPFAAELALPVLVEGGTDVLERAVRRLGQAAAEADTASAVDAHMEFHKTFYELADHRLLLETWRNLESGLRLTFAADQLSPGRPVDLVEPHQALLECVQQGDIVALRAGIEAHLMPSVRGRPAPQTSGSDALSQETEGEY